MLDENGKAKFADFGASKLLTDQNDICEDTAGTYLFLAPECCDPSIKSYSGKAADIWALGVSLFGFTFNALPFYAEQELEILDMVTKKKLEMPSNRNVSDGLKEIIAAMLEKDPSKRITIAQLKENKWINEGFHYTLCDDEVKCGIMGHYKKEEN